MAKNGGRSKYHARPVWIDGIRFASKREGQRYEELKLLARSGEIRDLELQPRFPIVVGDTPVKIRSAGYPNGRRVSYVADFKYRQGDREVVEDVKGMDTPVSQLKRALVEAVYGVNVRVVR